MNFWKCGQNKRYTKLLINMKNVRKFQKGVKLYLQEGTVIRVLFEDGLTKEFDVKNVFERIPEYKCLCDRKLFEKAKLIGWGGISWSPEIDLGVDTIYYEGKIVESPENALSLIVGFKIKQARLEKELSQQDLAKITGLDQSEISKLEKGLYNPSIKFLDKISKALGKKLIITL